MSAAVQPLPLEATHRGPRVTTLLELVRTLGEVTEDDGEIVATVLWMLQSGHVRLCGNFRNAPIEDFLR